MTEADRRQHSAHWTVRYYEVDQMGHLNNAVYLNYAEQVAAEHAELLGFGREWSVAQGGGWVVHRHEINYHRPARAGDEVEVTTRARLTGGARATRHTTIVRLSDNVLLADVNTEWVWVRLSDGRPARVPPAMVAYLEQAGEDTG